METSKTDSGRRGFLLVCATALLAAGSFPVLAQESASYVMERVTVSSTTLEATSANFGNYMTLGQEGPVGSISVCNAGAHQSTGFWSIRGDAPVPIVLEARKDPGNPAGVELSWSGSVPLFEVFSSDSAIGLVNPANSLIKTALCAISDVPPPNMITYYSVLPVGNQTP